MIRVLHVFKTYWPETFGGVERSIDAIIRATSPHGVHGSVLALGPADHDRSFNGYELHLVRRHINIASTGFGLGFSRRLARLAACADIVHYHFPWPAMDVAHFASRHQKPSIVTYHSDIVKQMCLRKLYSPLMHWFLADVDRIVATSPQYATSSRVLQKFTDKVSVVPIGLDPKSFPAASAERVALWRDRLPRRFILFVGVLRYYKGLRTLIDAAGMSRVPVVIAGTGPKNKELRRRAQSRANGMVSFVGWVDDEDKAALLELCAAFVLPSHMRSEAYGLVLVEASLFGRPLISCEIGTGTSFVNIAGNTGLIVPPDSPADLAKAMLRLHLDAEYAARLGRNSRDRFNTELAMAPMGRRYVHLYRNMLGRD